MVPQLPAAKRTATVLRPSQLTTVNTAQQRFSQYSTRSQCIILSNMPRARPRSTYTRLMQDTWTTVKPSNWVLFEESKWISVNIA